MLLLFKVANIVKDFTTAKKKLRILQVSENDIGIIPLNLVGFLLRASGDGA